MGERSALVTGASRGIGAEIARRLAAEGYDLTLAARSGDALDALCATLQEQGAVCQAVTANMRDEEDVAALARAHRERYGALDLLVLNAGVGRAGAIAEQPLRSVDLQVDVNLRSSFQLLQEVLPLLRAAAADAPERGARVVALASLAGVVAEAGLSAYGATKAALISLCESVCVEHSSEGVSATAISPGYVRTDMSDWVADRIPPDEMIRTIDVAEIVACLTRLSPYAVVPHIVITRPGASPWRA